MGRKKAWRKAPGLYGKYNDRLLALTFFIFFNLTKQRIYAKIYTLFKGDRKSVGRERVC